MQSRKSLISTQVLQFDGLCCVRHCWGFVNRVSFSFPSLLVTFFCWPNFTATMIGILNVLRVDLVRRQLKHGFACLGTRIAVNYLLPTRIFCSFMVYAAVWVNLETKGQCWSAKVTSTDVPVQENGFIVIFSRTHVLLKIWGMWFFLGHQF